MAKPSQQQDRWEDPIVAEVRKVRQELFEAAGCDLDEFCRRLRQRQLQEGGRVVTRPARKPQVEATAGAPGAKPSQRKQPTRKKPARG